MFFSDITERKQAERATQLSEQRYRSLATATTQIVWTTDPQGYIVEPLPMWLSFTGQRPEDNLGMGWLEALHPDDRDRTASLWSSALKTRSFYETEYRMRRYDGEYRWMAAHGVPVLGESGDIRQWILTCADITDRKLAEREIHKLNQELEARVTERTSQLQEANQELEAFAYSVSHDLRAPLRAVDGFSRILLEEYAPQLPAEARHYLKIARENALQMGGLIDGLLRFSRFGRQPLCKQLIAPADLVREVWQDLRLEKTAAMSISPSEKWRPAKAMRYCSSRFSSIFFERAEIYPCARNRHDPGGKHRGPALRPGLFRSRQWRRFRYALPRQALRRLPAPPSRRRIRRHRCRSGNRAAHRPPPRRTRLGRRGPGPWSDILFHAHAGGAK